jgi:intracellular multiplication protein IcmL
MNDQSNKSASRPQAPRKVLAGSNARAEEGMKKLSHRNDFYRDGDKKLYIAAIASIIGLGLQSAIAFTAFTAKSERVYFATDKSGSLIQLVPLGQPNQKDSVVAQWTANALTDTFSFNFYDYADRLNKSTMAWFTKEGGDGLLAALSSVGVIDALKERKMILSLSLEHTPVLIKQGPDQNGIWTWTFQMKAVMTYRTQSSEFSNPVTFMIQVNRRSVMENAEGLGITKVIMQRR